MTEGQSLSATEEKVMKSIGQKTILRWTEIGHSVFGKGRDVREGKVDDFYALCGLLKRNLLQVKEMSIWTKFGLEPIVAISEALKTNTTLETLYFCHESLADEHIAAISESLKVNTTLRKLGLRDKKIGDEAVKMICDSLMVNSRLTTLQLQGDTFEGVISFCKWYR